MNKIKIIAVFCACAAVGTVLAGPRGGHCPGGHRPGGHRPSPIFHHHGGFHHHHGGFWGRGGRNFWPGFVGGLVGGVVANSFNDTVVTTPVVTTPVVTTPVVTTPVVVTTPTVVAEPVVVSQPTQVWVEGCYVNQVQANGTVLRVWKPGHYEVR